MTDQDVGTVVANRYRLVSKIGTGSMGDVYEANHVELGTSVALKVLRSEVAGDREIAARLIREGKAMGMFKHRNIVELIDVGSVDDETVFVATELVRGVTLRAVLDDGVVEQRRALNIARQMLDALGHAHALGVFHRDVKPENVMLADGGDPESEADLVKMLDFGVAKLAGDTAALLGEGKLTRTGFGLFGSPLYVAPEIVLGTLVDARADLYSVGVILFEMLAGVPPFDDPDVAVLIRMHAATPAPTLKERAPDRVFTPELEFLVAEALAKKPDRRFASVADMAAAIDRARHSLDLAEVPPPVPMPATLSTRLGFVPPPLHAASPRVTPAIGAPMAPHPPLLHSDPIVTWSPGAVAAGTTSQHPPSATPSLLTPKQRRVFLIGAGSLILFLTCAVALSGGGEAKKREPATGQHSPVVAPQTSTKPIHLAARANDLLVAGKATAAIELLERELSPPGAPADAAAFMVLGHARNAAGRRLDALAAYERSLSISSDLATDAHMRSNVTRMLDSRDTIAGVVALDFLAMRVSPPGRDVIVAHASNGKVLEVRRRALAIAEREGIADGVDHVESWSLDLAQATTCDERRAAIGRLRTTDRRATTALRRARTQHKCIDRDAAEAIAFLEARQ